MIHRMPLHNCTSQEEAQHRALETVTPPVPKYKGLDFNALILCWLLASLILSPCAILILPVICVHITIKWPDQQGPQQAIEHLYKKGQWTP